MIERNILIGFITSTEFLQQIRPIWKSQLMESVMAKQLSLWCIEYFDAYSKCPGENIEQIYYEKIKNVSVTKDTAEDIAEILEGLSTQAEKENFNLDYLITSTRKFFNSRSLTIHTETIQALLAKESITEAEKFACDYKPIANNVVQDIDLSDEEVLDRVDKAFNIDNEPLIHYPGALGQFWNDQLIRGAFVALLASEKRGKSWWLLDFAIRACKQKKKVAFFQAGDMSESAQLKRICIYLAKKSNFPKYTGELLEPVKDCIRNQMNACKKEERDGFSGVFADRLFTDIKYGVTLEDLETAFKDAGDYKPCTFCEEYAHGSLGTPWLKKVNIKKPLFANEAKRVITDFFIKHKVQFKLSTHPNDTLSIKGINAILDIWEKQDEFVPDVVVIDYADLLIFDGYEKDYRQQQNKIWKGLRNLSQTRGNPLVITATQADAASYEKNSLRMSNFSEDKRKFGHVSYMVGLNQDTKDREKKIGIMRLNEIVKREGEFFHSKEVYVLQNLKRGSPFLDSYF